MTAAPAARPRSCLGPRTFALLTLGFLFVVIYGSLVPFHYTPLPWGEAVARWQRTPWLILGIESRSDFVANILLFIPLSYLLMGSLGVDRGRAVGLFAACLVVPLCFGLSVAIEFTQLWFPPRTVSMNDIFAETVGGAIGAACWVLFGQRLTDYARSAWAALGPDDLAVRLLPGYLLLLVLIHVMPLDLTISPVEIYHKWKRGYVVLIPFTTPYGSFSRFLLKTAWNMFYFLPLGAILSRWPRGTFRGAGRVPAAGLAVAAAIEFMQLFVWTRFFDVTDIVTGTAAVWLGWRLTEAWAAYIASAPRPWYRHPLVRPCLFATWFVVIAAVNWYPFEIITAGEARESRGDDFQRVEWVLSDDGERVRPPLGKGTMTVATFGPLVVLTDMNDVRRRWEQTPAVPMVDLYYNTEYHAFDEVLRKTLHFLPLGMLLVPLSATNGRRGVWRALFVGLFFACLFEAGQLFVPDRSCSTSDVVVETSATVLGFLLFRRFLVLLENRPAVEPTSSQRNRGPVRIPVGLGVFVTEERRTG
jgi:VanZ family protein